jgi:chemotaxis protein CheX
MIGFSGDAAGCVVISFPKAVGVRAASTFARVGLGAGDWDFADALGELANMVAGNAKKDFEGVLISISLPSVIVGENHTVSKSDTSPRLVIPCETTLGAFSVEVGMKIEKEATVCTG